jgi:hypothetical protein
VLTPYLGALHLFFDESGDFAFPDDRFDAYVQAVLICPDSLIKTIERYVAEKKAEWGLDELHAVELNDDQLWEICRFIRSTRLALLAQVTDTNAMTQKIIESHRLDQAARIQKNYDDWREAGGRAPAIEEWYEAHIKRTAYPSRPTNSEWVQSDLLIELIHRALNKTIAFYSDDRWRPDFEDFRFILDGKLPGKLAAGEKQLQKILVPALGSGRFDLIGVIEWRQPPVHPFEAKYGTGDGTIDVNLLFEHGLQFEDSSAGLQLVDVVAYVIRRRILDPANDTIRWAWQTLRPLLIDLRGNPIALMRYRAGEDADTSLYASL